jgi:hypothetical protein
MFSVLPTQNKMSRGLVTELARFAQPGLLFLVLSGGARTPFQCTGIWKETLWQLSSSWVESFVPFVLIKQWLSGVLARYIIRGRVNGEGRSF